MAGESRGIRDHKGTTGHDRVAKLQNLAEQDAGEIHKMINVAEEQQKVFREMNDELGGDGPSLKSALSTILHDLEEIEKLTEDFEKTEERIQEKNEELGGDQFEKLVQHEVEDLESIKADLQELEHKTAEAKNIIQDLKRLEEELDKEESKFLEIERHIEKKDKEIEQLTGKISNLIERHKKTSNPLGV